MSRPQTEARVKLGRPPLWTEARMAQARDALKVGGWPAVFALWPDERPRSIRNALSTLSISLATVGGPRAAPTFTGIPNTGFWTAERFDSARAALRTGGWAAVYALWPERTRTAIQTALSTRGISIAKLRAGPPPIAALPPPKPTRVIRDGELDRGEREHLRKRIEFTIAQLVGEVTRKPDAVRAALKELAARDFALDDLARLHVDEDEVFGFSGGTTYDTRSVHKTSKAGVHTAA